MSEIKKKPECCEGACGGIGNISIVSVDESGKIDWTNPEEWKARINTENKPPERSKPFEITINLR